MLRNRDLPLAVKCIPSRAVHCWKRLFAILIVSVVCGTSGTAGSGGRQFTVRSMDAGRCAARSVAVAYYAEEAVLFTTAKSFLRGVTALLPVNAVTTVSIANATIGIRN
jgi:hypothetical protein